MKLKTYLLSVGMLASLLVLGSCETTRRRETSDPARGAQSISEEAPTSPSGASTRQVAQINEAGPPTFRTSQSVLAAAFIRQFGDGTVVDKIMVRQAPGAPKEVTTYYLIGMGLQDGNFRAMALPLRNTGNGALLLSTKAERYVLTGQGCPTCFFDFEDGQIIGSTCGDNSGGSRCTLRVLEENTLLAAARPRP